MILTYRSISNRYVIHAMVSQNFDFNLRRDHQKKKSYERHDYESVDGKSLCPEKLRKKIIQAVMG